MDFNGSAFYRSFGLYKKLKIDRLDYYGIAAMVAGQLLDDICITLQTHEKEIHEEIKSLTRWSDDGGNSW